MRKTKRGSRSTLLSVIASLTILIGLVSPASAAPDITPQIVGGGEATPDAYPFMVALVSSSQSNAYLGQYCGGSVVAPNWVMTAGHCVVGSTASSVDLVIGRHDLTSSDGERIGAKSITLHPSYNNRTLANDIALIELESPTSVAPIGLASASNASLWAPGTMATVTGWGFTESVPNYPEVLYEVDVPIWADGDCANSAVSRGFNATVMLCAGDVGVDSCGGDSGGPLFVPDGSNGYVQAGIVSWGIGCADANAPGVYAEVAAFSDWIAETIGDTPPPPPPPPPPPGDVSLLVSFSSDRSDPVNLDGATVDGTIYVFVSPSDGISSVTFTVNGARPKTDTSDPFDLAGTARNGDARGFNTTKLGSGDHTVEAVINYDDGSSETISATFSS